MTGLLLTALGACIWLAALAFVLDSFRRAQHDMDRHVDEALRLTETPVEDRPDWGLR